jgi:RNA polymerase sigma factor (sigma-70 family)
LPDSNNTQANHPEEAETNPTRETKVMATFNPEYWEVPTESAYLENISSERAMWHETETDRERRHAMQEFFGSVLPEVKQYIDRKLTTRQREVVNLYYFRGLSQEDIAATLKLSQSTVSRHLFGTVRNGRKVGGAVHKLRKVVEKSGNTRISAALATLQGRFAKAM